MSYYHILIEVSDHISTIEQTRDVEIMDIQDISPYLHSILILISTSKRLSLRMKMLVR